MLFNDVLQVVNGSKSNVLRGKKTFQSKLIIENNLKTDQVNGDFIVNVFTDYLSKSKPQVIAAEYSLNNITMGKVNYFNVKN